jgi:outer membrane protein TolC
LIDDALHRVSQVQVSMSTKRRFVYALAVISLVRASMAMAEDPLTLQEAVDRAITVSPDVEARVAAREATQSRAQSAGQLPDPELIVGVDNLPLTGVDAGSFTNDFMTMRKIGLMQTFPSSAKRSLRTRRASDAEQLATAEQTSTQLDVKRQTALAWIESYYAEQTIVRLRNLETDIDLQTQLAEAAIKSGRMTVADAYESRSALLGVRDRILVAEQNVRHARAELARWLPEDFARPLASPPTFTQLPKTELLNNIHHHASLVAYDAQLDSARTEVALAESEKKPDWSVGVTYAKRGSDFSDMVSLEVRVGLPLFAGHRQDPEIAAKRAELKKLSAERESELRMHKAEVTQMIADWEVLLKRRAAFEGERLPLALERKQLANAAMQSGRADAKSALAAQVNFAEQQLQALDVESALGKRWAELSYLQTDRSQP